MPRRVEPDPDAVVAAPQGAMFYLMRGDYNADSAAYAPKKAGHSGWNELISTKRILP